jgi:hypothetical protein
MSEEAAAMASNSSKPSWINSQQPNPPEKQKRREKWKTSPSTEVTSDRGENARTARERKHAENAPRAPAGARKHRN